MLAFELSWGWYLWLFLRPLLCGVAHHLAASRVEKPNLYPTSSMARRIRGAICVVGCLLLSCHGGAICGCASEPLPLDVWSRAPPGSLLGRDLASGARLAACDMRHQCALFAAATVCSNQAALLLVLRAVQKESSKRHGRLHSSVHKQCLWWGAAKRLTRQACSKGVCVCVFGGCALQQLCDDASAVAVCWQQRRPPRHKDPQRGTALLCRQWRPSGLPGALCILHVTQPSSWLSAAHTPCLSLSRGAYLCSDGAAC